MRKFIALYILTLAIFLVAISFFQVARAEVLSGNQKVLKSASELDYPPFAIVQPDGTADGFSVDLLKAATEAVGLSVTFKVGPWNELKQELADKVLDVLPLVSYSEERDKVYDFTTAYLRMNGTIFVREGNTAIKSLADLKNKEVLVMQGDTAHEYALKEKLSDTIIAKVSYEEAFKLLASGKHDAIVVQQIVGLQMIKKLRITNVVPVEQKNVTTLKPMALKLEGFEQKFCFAVPEGNKQHLSLLNEGLAIISLNGTYNTLYDKWFAPILPKPHVPFSELVKQFLAILVPLLLFVTLVGLWYLKRLVVKRTQYLELEIQQRKEVERALLESHDLLTNLARQVPGVVYQYRLYPDGRSTFPYASPGMNDIYEVTPEEVQKDATPVFSRLHPDDYDNVAAAIQESARTLQTFYCEYRVILPRQGLRWRWSQAQPERMEDGSTLWHGIISDITERKQAEKAIKLALAEKEVLLREVHHRVKNNMAAIIGLFDMQQQTIDDPQAKTALQELSSRVRAMSLVHEKLIHSESFSRIAFQDYIESLVSYVGSSFSSEGIHYEIAAQGVEVPLDLAVPCGMIINELIINAFKYAFPKERLKPGQEAARISVTMSHDNGTFSLSVADNGVGLPPGFDLQKAETLGLTLVRMLGEHQLGGRYEIDQNCGTRITLTFTDRKGRKAHE